MYKQAKLESLFKKTKLKTTFQISLYLHQFSSLSLIKQGNYFISLSLCSKIELLKQQSNPKNVQKKQNKGRTMFTNIFHIKYNNHTQILNHISTFSFSFQQAIVRNHDNEFNKLLFIFQLNRCKSQQSDQIERKVDQQYQNVGQFVFQMKTRQQISFCQLFQVKFQLPYAAQISGIAICSMVNFQITQSKTILQAQKQMVLIVGKPQKFKWYLNLISHLKKLIKKHRFASYLIQKIMEKTFIGFNAIMTIPSLKQNKLSYQQSSSSNTFCEKTLVKFQSLKDLSQIQMSQVSISQFCIKCMKQKQYKCNEEQFMNYLTYIQYQDRKLESLLCQLKRIASLNAQMFHKLYNCIEIVKQQKTSLAYRISLQNISSQYERQKQIIYNQKITIFGTSLASASQQMKIYIKQISTLKSKSKQKQKFFTSMSQLFNLIPECDCDLDSMRFDKCPCLFYSKTRYDNGLNSQQIEHEDEGWDQDQEKNSDKSIKNEKLAKKQQYRNVFLLAHGYQATSMNMQKLKLSFRKLFAHSKFLLLKSYSQHMDHSLQQMGKKAAKQIQVFLQDMLHKSSSKKIRIIMVAHSMGGIILRASFQHLPQKIRKLFHTFISFATPHLGYINCKNFLTETGMKLIQSMHPSVSLKQLSNKDNQNIKQTFIYKLSDTGSLKQFQNIIVLSSLEDKYVPWNSARIQLYKQPQGIGGKNTTGGWSIGSQKHFLRYVQQEMMNHILGIGQKNSKVKNVFRFQVDFNNNHFNLDSMIGRTSHVAFLINQHLPSMIFQNCLNSSLYAQLKNC